MVQAVVRVSGAANTAVRVDGYTDDTVMQFGTSNDSGILYDGSNDEFTVQTRNASGTLTDRIRTDGNTDTPALATVNIGSVDLDASGAIQVNSSGGAISIANDNIDQTVNLATAGTRTLNIGIDDNTDLTTINVNGNMIMKGVTPVLTIGDGDAEDAAIVFDSNNTDYHFGLDASHDSSAGGIFLGSTTTIGSNIVQAWQIHANGPLVAFGSTPSASYPFKVYQSYARTANGGNLQWFSSTMTLTGDAGAGTHIGMHVDNTLVMADDDAELTNVYQLRVDGAQITQPEHPDPPGTISGNTAAIYIPNAYTGTVGGENYSLFIDNGAVRIDKSLWVESTPTEGSAGEQLTSGGADTAMTWAAAGSLGRFKETIDELSPTDALEKVLSWTPRLFKYRDDAEVTTHDTDTIYTGVYGEDAPEVMHHDGKIFSPVSGFGYTVGAIQMLTDRIEELETRLATV